MDFWLVFAMPLCASVYMCLVVACWERADLLALVCGDLLCVCHSESGVILDCIDSSSLHPYLLCCPLNAKVYIENGLKIKFSPITCLLGIRFQ